MQTVKTDQTRQMPSLIGVLAGCTGHFVGFVMLRLIIMRFTSLIILYENLRCGFIVYKGIFHQKS